MTNFEKVKEFHEKFKCTTNHSVINLYDDEKILRIRLMSEELAELIAAMQLNNLELTADSIADLLYVTYGTAVAYGFPMDEIFKEVHRSNMTKSLEKDGGGKVTKGEDFDPPNIKHLTKEEKGLEWYYNTPKDKR